MGICASVVPESGRRVIRKFLRKSSNRSNHHHHHHHYSLCFPSTGSAANSRHSRSPSRGSDSPFSHERRAHLLEKLTLDTDSQLDSILSTYNVSRENVSAAFFQYGDYDHNTDFTKLIDSSSAAPSGQDFDLWVLLPVLCFVKVLQVFYQLVVAEDCTSDSCPTMSAGIQYEYRWRDVETGDVLNVGASSYMHFLFEWAESISENQNLSNNVQNLGTDMARRLFRAYAHIFHEHYSHICSLGVSSEFDARLIHLTHFLLKHKMITGKEVLPMRLFFSGKVKNSCSLELTQN